MPSAVIVHCSPPQGALCRAGGGLEPFGEQTQCFLSSCGAQHRGPTKPWLTAG